VSGVVDNSTGAVRRDQMNDSVGYDRGARDRVNKCVKQLSGVG